MNWQPIETYKKPENLYEYARPPALFFCPDYGVVIVMCVKVDDDPDEYSYFFGEYHINPTHWMPLPKDPK